MLCVALLFLVCSMRRMDAALQLVLHYSDPRIDDQPLAVRSSTVDANWPRQGNIDFKNVYISYHPSLEPIVQDFSLSVRHGQKIGICGRTGSGKSTVVNAIFRLTDVASGTILVDGVDINELEPYHLRCRLAAVPQDTLMIEGTLR